MAAVKDAISLRAFGDSQLWPPKGSDLPVGTDAVKVAARGNRQELLARTGDVVEQAEEPAIVHSSGNRPTRCRE